MNWHAGYALLLAGCTLVTWISAIILQKFGKIAKATLTVCTITVLGLLFYFKYASFAIHTVGGILGRLGLDFEINAPDIILPVGISFFTFQALGYCIDVYRGKLPAETNLMRYALFVSFFPQLVAGPIERSEHLLCQLREPRLFDAYRVRRGMLICLYGLFLKLVIADNIALIIDPIFEAPYDHAGAPLSAAAALFAFQIYCDFQGYTKIAIGSAIILGFELRENFNSPYLAVGIRDFWRRWHISLTTWFRDYLYIPLGGNRKGVLRTAVNTFIVFMLSGLWHGAAWHFVAWGGINGLLIILESLLSPVFSRLSSLLHIDKKRFAWRLFQHFYTFIIVDLTWIFFRAASLGDAFYIIRSILTTFDISWFQYSEYYMAFFGSAKAFIIIACSIIFLLFTDHIKDSGRDASAIIFSQQAGFRWLFYFAMFLLIIHWGVYGGDYAQTEFIYFQF